MKSISLYEEKHSLLNSFSPGSKLLYVLAAILIPIFLKTKWAGITFIVISILLLTTSKVIKKALPILGVSGFIILTVLIIQGMFRAGNETVVFHIGPAVFYQEGLLFALGIAINVFNILMSFCVLVLTTKPSDMIENFIRRGFSPRLGYVFISIFEIIPQMTDTMATITDAQRSRGMETEGSLFIRIKAFLPLISPVVMSSLVNTKERAVALEVRGFNAKNKKTFLNEAKVTPKDKMIQWIMIIGMAAALIWRVSTWLR